MGGNRTGMGGKTGKRKGVQLKSVPTSILSFGGEPETEKWDLEVEGSVYGGQGFGPCNYPKGWTLNKLKASSSSLSMGL